METQESYNLHVKTIFATAATPANPRSTTSVSITATTFFGARHAIETLSQIMAWDKTLESMIMLTDANISDSPAFVHRGLIIDTSRNFSAFQSSRRLSTPCPTINSTYSIGI
jgi:hexosaminidase